MAFLSARTLFCLSALSATLCAQTITVSPVHGATKLDFEKGQSSQVVEREITEINVKSIGFDTSMDYLIDPGGQRAQGGNFYTFHLAPKETISLKLTAEDANRFGMMACAPVHPDKMNLEFMRLDRMPRSLRSSKFSVQNITGEPYAFTMMVYGAADFWYKLKIDRKL